MCDKRDRAITCQFCHDLHSPLTFSGLLQKDLFKEKGSLAESYFNKIIVTLVTEGLPSSFSAVLLRKLPIISVTKRVGSHSLGCHAFTSRVALRLPPFDQAPFPHPSTGEGFNQGLATSCFLPLEGFC